MGVLLIIHKTYGRDQDYSIVIQYDGTVTFYREIKLKMGFGVVHCCYYVLLILYSSH